MNILHILANPKPTEDSTSKQLATSFFVKIVSENSDATVTNVDLVEEPPPVYSYEQYRNFWFPVLIDGYAPTKKETAASEYATTQAEQVRKADVLVLTMPMWNFSMPGIMKCWLEHILSPGLLYEVTPEGNKPLHHLRKVILLVSSFEVFKEGDPRDGLSPAIEAMFEDIGVDDISLAWADGQNPLLYQDGEPRKALAVEMAEELAEEVCEIESEQG